MKQYKKGPDGFTDVRGDYNPAKKSRNTRQRILRNGKRTARQEGKTEISREVSSAE